MNNTEPITNDNLLLAIAGLACIPFFPDDPVSRTFICDDLIELCQNPAELFAVVKESRRTMKRWEGMAEMIEILNYRRRHSFFQEQHDERITARKIEAVYDQILPPRS